MDSLHDAARNGDLDDVIKFISYDADVNAKENDGSTPLHKSAWYGHADIVRALIAAGADVNAKDEYGSAPLHVSAYEDHADIVRALIGAGADVNAKENDGSTPLHKSANNGHVDIVRALISAGASASVEDDYGRTALDMVDLPEGEALIKYTLLYQDGAKLKPIMQHGNCVYNEVWSRSEKQVDEMKETFLGGSCVSFYKFMTETNKNKLALYSSEENFCIKNDFERLAYIKKFPMYTEDIEVQFNEGRERANLLHKSQEFINKLLCGKLTEDIIRKISEYMTNDDIKNILG